MLRYKFIFQDHIKFITKFINQSKLGFFFFFIKPYCSRACSWTIFFAWTWFIFQTNLKLKLKFGLFINKQTCLSFLSSQDQVVYERLFWVLTKASKVWANTTSVLFRASVLIFGRSSRAHLTEWHIEILYIIANNLITLNPPSFMHQVFIFHPY